MSSKMKTWLILSCLVIVSSPLEAETTPSAGRRGRIELIRDHWGIPHVFADTDAGAMYGLGYATAEDRGFQMYYSLRIIQGRLAELRGNIPMRRGKYTAVHNDRKMRAFGFYEAAKTVAGNLDKETTALLRAYCQGVNDYFERHRRGRHPLFAELGLSPEPWTPADCIVSWWHMGQFFATDGTRDLIASRNLTRAPGAGRPTRGGRRFPLTPPAGVTPMPPDDTAAVVRMEDLAPEWIERVNRFARAEGMLPKRPGSRPSGPKFSHAWVVGGAKTTTGGSVLVSDPQTPVRNPSLFYEFHVVGQTFNARGIGVPGSPAILIGFTDRVAWGLTALGADQADLFRLKTDEDHPNQYFFDGRWRNMQVRKETIEVRGGRPVPITVRRTHLGPVVTEFCFARPADGQVALKRIPLCETDRETIQGALAMMRAKDAEQFAAALPGWRFPSVNIVFGDREGNIGYHTLAAIPIRSPLAARHGRVAHDGTSSKFDWQGIVPYGLLPHVVNPKRGFLATANHRPIGSWYPIPLGTMTGSGGDTVRSWRLRQRLAARQSFAPADVLDIHFDNVHAARAAIVRAGLHLRDVLKRQLSAEASRALSVLDGWYKAGASSALTEKGAALATEINTYFRMGATELVFVYGGGESGLSYFLKTLSGRIEEHPKAALSDREQRFIDAALAGAWRSALGKYGRQPAQWDARARQAVPRRKLGYHENLDGAPSVDRACDLPFPALTNVDGGTIQSQAAQAYTQFVPMHDPDAAMSILPIGQSERPDSPFRTSTMQLWAAGKLHPAPLSRQAVEKYAGSKITLSP